MPIDEKFQTCYDIGVGRTDRQERKRKGGQTDNRTSRTQSDHRRSGFEK